MVVMPTIINGVPVKLPTASNVHPTAAPRQLQITVKDDGTVYLGGEVVRREQVATELQRLHATEPARPVAVRGDKSVAYGEVVAVLDDCRAAGYEDVRLVTQKRE